MDKETREFLESIKNELQDFRKETNNRFDDVERRFNSLEEGQNNLKEGQKEIKVLIEELDPKNANRHLELKDSINELRKDLTNVEIITSSNWNEIAKLKKIE